jgi:hypothetical protein
MEFIEGAVKRRTCVVLAREPASLGSLRAATAESVSVRPQRVAIATCARELEDLSALGHRHLPFSAYWLADLASSC